jgi:hypothetical protein
LLEDARAHAQLPILDNIRLATPCGASWSQMTGDDRKRMCGACNKHVYNLSGMTREEAHALIVENEGTLCARFFQRADGTIMLADCLVGKQQKRKRALVAIGASAALAGGGAAYALTRTHPVKLASANVHHVAPPVRVEAVRPIPPAPPYDYTEVAGGISLEPEPPPPPPVHKLKPVHE